MLVDEMPVAAIRIGANRRKLNPLKVAELAESIQESGLLNPPTVTEDGALIAGLHRIKACEQLGWASVPVIKAPLSGVSAELAEIDENLVRNDLTVMERGEHLGRRKELYEVLHPSAIRPKGGRPRNDEIISPFSEDAAEKIGVSQRTVQQEVQIAEAIAPDVKEIIRGTDVADSKTDLLALARMEPEEQREVVAVIQDGRAANVREAQQSQSVQALMEREVSKEVRRMEREETPANGGGFKPQVLWQPSKPSTSRPDVESIALWVRWIAQSPVTGAVFKEHADSLLLEEIKADIPKVRTLLDEIERPR